MAEFDNNYRNQDNNPEASNLYNNNTGIIQIISLTIIKIPIIEHRSTVFGLSRCQIATTIKILRGIMVIPIRIINIIIPRITEVLIINIQIGTINPMGTIRREQKASVMAEAMSTSPCRRRRRKRRKAVLAAER